MRALCFPPEVAVVDPRPKSASGDAIALALDIFEDRSHARVGSFRLVVTLAMLALAGILGLAFGVSAWRAYVIPFGGYAAAAVLLCFLPQSRPGRIIRRYAIPTLDVLAVFGLQEIGVRQAQYPSGVAGWTLGAYVLLVVLSALALRQGALRLTVVTAFICESILLWTTGRTGIGLTLASGAVLFLAGAAASWSARRLLDLSADLVQAQHDSEQLVSLLVHDMRGPLTAISGTLDLLQGDLGRVRPELQDALRGARDSTRRLAAMMSDLIQISRLESGGLEPRVEPTPVDGLVERVARTYRGHASSQGVVLLTRVANGLVASLDGALVERLLDNLVSNALKFTRRGNRLEVSAERDGGALVLRVRNDGPPIPLERRGALFQKYGALEVGTSGNGLGLYLCRLVTDAHGGSIELEDETGWPVSFRVRLPASATVPAMPAEATPSGRIAALVRR